MIRLPPSDVDLEQSVLGAAIQDGDVLGRLAGWLQPNVFLRNNHEYLWGKILDQHDKGSPTDMIAMWDVIKSDPLNQWEKSDYHELFLKADPAHAIGHARKIFDHAARRRLIEIASELSRKCYDCQMDPAELRVDVEAQLQEIAELGSDDAMKLGTLIPELIGDLEKRREGVATGIMTPWITFNTMTDGLRNGELTVIAGRTSMGKSAISLALFSYVGINWNHPCLFVSLEMANKPLLNRILASASGINSQGLRMGCDLSETEFANFGLAQHVVGQAPLYVLKKPRSSITQIVMKSRAIVARYKIKMIIVDHLQLIKSDDPAFTNGPEKIGDNVRQLKDLAVELAIPVVLLSQINREVKSRADHRPQLFDLKGSGGIEEHTDVAILIHRPSYYEPGPKNGDTLDPMEINVAKNRDGPTGEFMLGFDAKTGRFEEMYEQADVPEGPVY